MITNLAQLPSGTVFRTKNYDLFKLNDNRVLSTRHIKELKGIFRKTPYKESLAILVNSDGTIRDGQHHFCALRELGKEIVFKVDDTIGANIAWLLRMPSVDHKRLKKVLCAKRANKIPVATTLDVMDTIEKLYNKGLAREKWIFIQAMRNEYTLGRKK